MENATGPSQARLHLDAKDLLHQLEAARAQLAGVELYVERAVAALIPDEVAAAIAQVQVESQADLIFWTGKCIELDAQVKDIVLQLGETVTGDSLQAVWNQGRISWDDKGLQGYAVEHPALLQLRHAGRPSVSIRKAPVKRAAN